MSKNRFILAIALVFSALPASVAIADDERMTAAIETRQGLFKMLGHYAGPIIAMARGQLEWDQAKVQANAARLAQLAPMIPELYGLDTRASETTTESLPGIWDNLEDFSERANKLAAAATKMAGTSNKAEGLAALQGVGGSCKGCHDNYREDS